MNLIRTNYVDYGGSLSDNENHSYSQLRETMRDHWKV